MSAFNVFFLIYAISAIVFLLSIEYGTYNRQIQKLQRSDADMLSEESIRGWSYVFALTPVLNTILVIELIYYLTAKFILFLIKIAMLASKNRRQAVYRLNRMRSRV